MKTEKFFQTMTTLFLSICSRPLNVFSESLERFSQGRSLEPESMSEEREAREYDIMIKKNEKVMHGPFVKLIKDLDVSGGRILDIGTGTGQLPIKLAKVFPGVRVTGVDLSNEMLTLARKNAAECNLSDRVTFERCDGKELPYPDGSFDLVISNFTLHHLEKPEIILNQALRMTGDNGTVLIRDILRPPLPLIRLLGLYMHIFLGYSSFITQRTIESFESGLTLNEMKQAVLSSHMKQAAVHRHMGLYGLITLNRISLPCCIPNFSDYIPNTEMRRKA